MTKYIVNYTRAAQEGHKEQKMEIPVEALDPSAAALIAGAKILADTLYSGTFGVLAASMGLDVSQLGDVTEEAFRDCVTVQVLSA